MHSEAAVGDPASISVPRSIARIGGFCAGFALLYAVMVETKFGQELDSESFSAVSLVPGFFLFPANLVRTDSPWLLAVAGAVFGVWTIVRHRFADGFRAVTLVVFSVGVSEVLKDVALQRPQLGVGGYSQNTFPSGHVAFALSVAVGIAVLLPAARWRWRWPAVLLAGLIAAGTAWASFVSFAHRPSDVIGGALVVGAVASTVFWGRRSVVGAIPPLGLLLLGIAVAGGVVAVIGGILTALGFAGGSLIGLPGWFLVCVMPVVGVIGLIPHNEPGREGEDRVPTKRA